MKHHKSKTDRLRAQVAVLFIINELDRKGDKNPMKTESGNHIIFHTDNCPFEDKTAKLYRGIPADYFDKAFEGRWFFVSVDGNPDHFVPCSSSYTALGKLRGYPMLYSLGYALAEDALKAAEEWEGKKESLHIDLDWDNIPDVKL